MSRQRKPLKKGKELYFLFRCKHNEPKCKALLDCELCCGVQSCWSQQSHNNLTESQWGSTTALLWPPFYKVPNNKEIICLWSIIIFLHIHGKINGSKTVATFTEPSSLHTSMLLMMAKTMNYWFVCYKSNVQIVKNLKCLHHNYWFDLQS